MIRRPGAIGFAGLEVYRLASYDECWLDSCVGHKHCELCSFGASMINLLMGENATVITRAIISSLIGWIADGLKESLASFVIIAIRLKRLNLWFKLIGASPDLDLAQSSAGTHACDVHEIGFSIA